MGEPETKLEWWFGVGKAFDETALVDQALHLLMGAVLVGLICYTTPELACWTVIVTACLGGLVREVTQFQRNHCPHLVDRVLDVAFWGLGGAVAWTVCQFI